MARPKKNPLLEHNPGYEPTRKALTVPGKLAGINVEAVLDRIAEGDWPARIAQELGVTKAALYFHLKEHPEYQACREISTDSRLDDGLEKLALTTDLTLARTEEVKLRRLEWRAEREFPHRWGAKQQVTVTTAPVFVIHVSGDSIPVLDVTDDVEDAEDAEVLP